MHETGLLRAAVAALCEAAEIQAAQQRATQQQATQQQAAQQQAAQQHATDKHWAAGRAARQPVTQVTLALGPGVDREAAMAAWTTAASGTLAAGARVTWRRSQDLLECLACGAGYAGDALTRCPNCGGDGLTVEAAPEIVIADYRV